MKRFVLVALLTAGLLGLAGCATKEHKPSAPLPTSGETAPPMGCQDLRQRGGAC